VILGETSGMTHANNQNSDVTPQSEAISWLDVINDFACEMMITSRRLFLTASLTMS
jgi:hypothetical protein